MSKIYKLIITPEAQNDIQAIVLYIVPHHNLHWIYRKSCRKK